MIVQQAVVAKWSNERIGSAIRAEFSAARQFVVATDFQSDRTAAHQAYVSADPVRFCADGKLRESVIDALVASVGDRPLGALINSAAPQYLGKAEALNADAWRKTLDVNLLAPFLLIQGLLPLQERACGSVTNLASIRARATKPGFSANASSEAGLVGLTRNLALELGARTRVNAICAAAIATSMLRDGFAGHEPDLQQLASMHPRSTVGDPADVAKAAL
ncbi:MAG: SDR family oxidoreductase [Proteobacteria bacterium]|nr:SDR family oxidoreductase [Pseudomonadota bacterium]